MSLLLASQAPPLDPANFPFPQPEVPVRRVVRATALLIAASVFNPAPVGLGAVRFDSATDALKSNPAGVVPANNTAYTAMGWFKYDSAAPDDSTFAGSDAAGTGLFLETKTGVLSLVDTHGFSRPTNIPGTLVNGQWYFAALRVNGLTATIFRGDEKTATIASAPGTIVAQGNLQRWWFSQASVSFVGSMSDWLVYDALLTDAEIEAQRLAWAGPGNPNYRTIAARAANLTAFYRLESTSNKLADSSGNGNNLIQDSTGPWEESAGPDLSFRTEWLQPPADVVRRRAPLLDSPQAFVQLVGASAPVQLDWLVPPADLVRAQRRAQPAAAAFVPIISERLDWSPEFPDFARGPRRPTPDACAFVQLAGDAAVRLDWLPTFADFARGPRRPNAGPPSALVQLAGDAAVRLDWLPVFPEFARAARRPNVGMATAALVQLVAPSVQLDWLPVFPVSARNPPRPNVGPVASALVQLVVPSVQLDWLPQVPLYPAKPRAATQPAAVAFVYGPPVLVVPFDWYVASAVPARARPRALVVEPPTLVRIAPAVQLDWLPSFADFARGLRRPLSLSAAFVPIVLVQADLPFSFGGASSAVIASGSSTALLPSSSSASITANGSQVQLVDDGSSEAIE